MEGCAHDGVCAEACLRRRVAADIAGACVRHSKSLNSLSLNPQRVDSEEVPEDCGEEDRGADADRRARRDD
jgi:hypothetical protein